MGQGITLNYPPQLLAQVARKLEELHNLSPSRAVETAVVAIRLAWVQARKRILDCEEVLMHAAGSRLRDAINFYKKLHDDLVGQMVFFPAPSMPALDVVQDAISRLDLVRRLPADEGYAHVPVFGVTDYLMRRMTVAALDQDQESMRKLLGELATVLDEHRGHVVVEIPLKHRTHPAEFIKRTALAMSFRDGRSFFFKFTKI